MDGSFGGHPTFGWIPTKQYYSTVWLSRQNSQAIKKVRPMQKTAWKSFEIQGGGPEVAVMVG